MSGDKLIEIEVGDDARQRFVERFERAREVWISHPDKSRMNDAERLKLMLVLIDLQMSYVIDAGLDGGGPSSGHYIAYLCMLLSVAATGFRSETYPDILGPDDIPGFTLQTVTED